MGLLEESDLGVLLRNEVLMDQVVKAMVEHPETMDSLVEEIADSVQDALGDDASLRQRLVSAAIANDAFKQKLIDKLINDLD